MKIHATRVLYISLLLIFIAGCQAEKKKKEDTAPRKIELLFLGHAQEHHNSRAYMPVLATNLSQSGINITYTENLDDLNPETLDLYDGLIIYANHESLNPTREKALLDFVDEGHALIPIHSASFCFKDSPAYIELVGGQFMSHETGTFTANIIKKEHPAMQSAQEFSTWDETYRHTKMADDITVLMELVEGTHHEPWTWVKNYGRGKVFYTAYGHDERTWNNPGFQQLIKAGIVWAVNESVRKNWEAFTGDIPKLEYQEMANIPNYEKRDPAPKYQLPLTPEASKKLMQVPPGFSLELFAAEPDIINPIAMNWDEKGRLWVVETVDYPNTVLDDKGTGDDRIKICEDTNGDGKADKFTVFADKLNIPTSFVFSKGGIIVSQAPDFLFLKDTSGDDVADVRETIITGWGVFDTHAGPSNLQYGIDNHIYGVVGYSGFKGQIFGRDQEFRQGVYRFDPGLENFEFLTNTSNNTWGLGITEDNSVFASTANNTHSVFLGIPNRLLSTVEGISVEGSKKIDGHYAMQPITANIRQVDVFGGFTAAAGHHFYTARDYPEAYWNKIAFVCEPTGGVVHQARIMREGAGYREEDAGNLLAAADEWVSPVEAKTGPDGAVWVLDWYNFIVQHNPTPTEERGGYNAENGLGNAYINPLRDISRGRIWRVVPASENEYKKVSLDTVDPAGLLKALSNDNLLWRLHAQRLLVEGGKTDVLNGLYTLINDSSTDNLGLNPGALHALWTLDGLGVIEVDTQAFAVVRGALFHPASSVRRAAVQILPKSGYGDKAILESGVLHDRDPGVQLQAILNVAEREPSEDIGKVLYGLSQERNVIMDKWLSQAVYTAATKHISGFITAFQKEHPSYSVPATTIAMPEGQELQAEGLAETFVKTYIGKVGQTVAAVGDMATAGTSITIRTIQNEMKYDITEFVVEAGQIVELVFENTDFMQHNLVITQPGKKELVGMAADKLATDPNGAAQNYVPSMPEVLFATAIINPEDKVTLRFTAPTEPGIYPYICTFPGHWRIMQGTMRVVAAKGV